MTSTTIQNCVSYQKSQDRKKHAFQSNGKLLFTVISHLREAIRKKKHQELRSNGDGQRVRDFLARNTTPWLSYRIHRTWPALILSMFPKTEKISEERRRFAMIVETSGSIHYFFPLVFVKYDKFDLSIT